jgi:hypothetical protein
MDDDAVFEIAFKCIEKISGNVIALLSVLAVNGVIQS